MDKVRKVHDYDRNTNKKIRGFVVGQMHGYHITSYRHSNKASVLGTIYHINDYKCHRSLQQSIVKNN